MKTITLQYTFWDFLQDHSLGAIFAVLVAVSVAWIWSEITT